MQTNYKGTNKLLVGIVLAVLAFWLFAQSMLNIAPDVQKIFKNNIWCYEYWCFNNSIIFWNFLL